MPQPMQAQVEKRVEVTKAYVPTVDDAVKLSIAPDMVDTVAIRPDIEYSITPSSLSTPIELRPISPAKLYYWEYNRPKPFYLKLGAGYPLNSEVDFYASSHNAGLGYISAFVNHDGEYARRRNFLGDKTSAVQMDNAAGIAAGLYAGRQTLRARFGYANVYRDRFALSGLRADYDDVSLDVRFGDDFSDLNRFNFEVGVHGALFFNNSAKVDYGFARQADAGADFRIARSVRRSTFVVRGGYDGYFGCRGYKDSADKSYGDNTFYAGLFYRYSGGFLDLTAGADYRYDKVSHRDKASHYPMPYLRAQFNISRDGFVPYIEFDSEYRNNSLRSLMQRNPYTSYLERYMGLPSTVSYNVRFGAEGRTRNDTFAYRAFFNMSFIDDNVYWYNFNDEFFLIDETQITSGKRNNQTVISFAADLEYRPVRQFEMRLRFRGHIFNDDKRVCAGRPVLEGRFNAAYSFGKFKVGLAASLLGVARWTVESVETTDDGTVMTRRYNTNIPVTVDLGVVAEWRVKKNFGLYVEGHNLANARHIAEFYNYWAYGPHFTFGIKTQF